MGIQAGQCFTDNDLNRFKTDKTVDKIVDDLKKDKDFLAIIESIKGMQGERAALLDRALQTYRKTWGELNLNPATASAEELRKGQTEAGHRPRSGVNHHGVSLLLIFVPDLRAANRD
ncbi:MAG: hypothetical protein LC795_10600 [Acidobacteria bacterium]|nr:hypothetical protein [Acidobacteriota bacterium]MCA1619739.1 hypothetical protein [Acidobacteriota bacterium]